MLGPALGYARDGYPLLPSAARTIGTVAEMFAAHWPTSAAVYLPGGQPPAAGAPCTDALVVLAAARLVRTRLIDNMAVAPVP